MEVISAPVGYVTSSRAEPYDDGWDDEVATITVDGERFDAEALQGLDQFSHAEIVYHFDRAPSTGIIHGGRHPRARASARVGDGTHAGLLVSGGRTPDTLTNARVRCDRTVRRTVAGVLAQGVDLMTTMSESGSDLVDRLSMDDDIEIEFDPATVGLRVPELARQW